MKTVKAVLPLVLWIGFGLFALAVLTKPKPNPKSVYVSAMLHKYGPCPVRHPRGELCSWMSVTMTGRCMDTWFRSRESAPVPLPDSWASTTVTGQRTSSTFCVCGEWAEPVEIVHRAGGRDVLYVCSRRHVTRLPEVEWKDKPLREKEPI